MKLVLLVSYKNSNLIKSLKKYIPDKYSLMEEEFGPAAMRFLKKMPAGLVMVDVTNYKALSWIEDACLKRPDLTFIAVGEKEIGALPEGYFYDIILTPFNSGQLRKILGRAWERIQLYSNARGLQKEDLSANGSIKTFSSNNSNSNSNGNVTLISRRKATPIYPGNFSLEEFHYLPQAHHKEQRILCDLSRALGNNFNSERLLELFMDSVVELLPTAKMSILLKNKDDNYLIFAQKGLEPHLCSGLNFNSSSGLISWLIEEGRIFIAAEASEQGGCLESEALQELQMLQAVVSVPLIAQGELLGTLNLGPKVTGAPFFASELEILYILCGNVAIALRDIDLHHQVINQKSYFESILQRMNSGVVAINKENRIITFNTRAEDLLQLSKAEAMGEDLRFLPAPLGDLLYATLVTGEVISKEEVELVKGRIPLEISTFQLLDQRGEVLGSVMIFDDISERKQLEAERRQGDQLDVLNKFVSQLAHEIKNPMVAIQTFSDLLKEKYEDSDFREYFSYTVSQELKRLNELVEQLIAFSAPLSYKYTIADIHEILDLGLLLLQEQGMGEGTTVDTLYCRERTNVRADKTLLARAFSYLFRHSFKALEKGGTIRISTAYEKDLFEGGGIRICFSDFQTTVAREDLGKLFDPLSIRLNGYLSLGLPVSRKIIEDHGGRIKAKRDKDKHLEIEVLLPIIIGEGGEKGE